MSGYSLERSLETILKSRTDRVLLVLDKVVDYYNIQCVLRIADSLGIQDVWVVLNKNKMKNRSISHRLIRGADLYLDVCLFDTSEELIAALQRDNRTIWATTLSPIAVELFEPDVNTEWTGDYMLRPNNFQSMESLLRSDDEDDIEDSEDDGTNQIQSSGVVELNSSLVIPDRLAIVMGREADGVGPELLAVADKQVYIPMVGFSESFNVSVATGLVLNRIMAMCPEARGVLSPGRVEILRAKWMQLQSILRQEHQIVSDKILSLSQSSNDNGLEVTNSTNTTDNTNPTKEDDGSNNNNDDTKQHDIPSFSISGVVAALQKGFQTEHTTRIPDVFPIPSTPILSEGYLGLYPTTECTKNEMVSITNSDKFPNSHILHAGNKSIVSFRPQVLIDMQSNSMSNNLSATANDVMISNVQQNTLGHTLKKVPGKGKCIDDIDYDALRAKNARLATKKGSGIIDRDTSSTPTGSEIAIKSDMSDKDTFKQGNNKKLTNTNANINTNNSTKPKLSAEEITKNKIYEHTLKVLKTSRELATFTSQAWSSYSPLHLLLLFYPHAITLQWKRLLALREMSNDELDIEEMKLATFFKGSLKSVQDQANHRIAKLDTRQDINRDTQDMGGNKSINKEGNTLNIENVDGTAVVIDSITHLGNNYTYNSTQLFASAKDIGLWAQKYTVDTLKVVFHRVAQGQFVALWLLAMLHVKSFEKKNVSDTLILGTVVSKGCLNKYKQLLNAYKDTTDNFATSSLTVVPVSKLGTEEVKADPKAEPKVEIGNPEKVIGNGNKTSMSTSTSSSTSMSTKKKARPQTLTKAQLSNRRLMSEIDFCYGPQAFSIPDLSLPIFSTPVGLVPSDPIFLATNPGEITVRHIYHRYRLKSIPAAGNQAIVGWLDGIPGFTLSFAPSGGKVVVDDMITTVNDVHGRNDSIEDEDTSNGVANSTNRSGISSSEIEKCITSVLTCFNFLSNTELGTNANAIITPHHRNVTTACEGDIGYHHDSIHPLLYQGNCLGMEHPYSAIHNLVSSQSKRVRISLSPTMLSRTHGATGRWVPLFLQHILYKDIGAVSKTSTKSANSITNNVTILGDAIPTTQMTPITALGPTGEDPHRDAVAVALYDITMANKYIRSRSFYLSQIAFARMIRSLILDTFQHQLLHPTKYEMYKQQKKQIRQDYIQGDDNVYRHPHHHTLRQLFPNNTWVQQCTVPSFEHAKIYYEKLPNAAFLQDAIEKYNEKEYDFTEKLLQYLLTPSLHTIVDGEKESEGTEANTTTTDTNAITMFSTSNWSSNDPALGLEGLLSRQLESFSTDVVTVFSHYMKIMKTSFVSSSMRLFNLAHSTTLEDHPGAYHCYAICMNRIFSAAFDGLTASQNELNKIPISLPISTVPDTTTATATATATVTTIPDSIPSPDSLHAIGVDDEFTFYISRFARIRREDRGTTPSIYYHDDESWAPQGGFYTEAEKDYIHAQREQQLYQEQLKLQEEALAAKVVIGDSTVKSALHTTPQRPAQSLFVSTAVLDRALLEEKERLHIIPDLDVSKFVVWPGDLRRQRIYLPSVGVDTSVKSKGVN